jgi:hypothetical protein
VSLDFYLDYEDEITKECVSAFSRNITHNLGTMADAAGIYEHLWHPERLGITRASELITPLECGLRRLKRSPKKYAKFNSPNGWGMYEHFVPFVEECLEACKKYPTAKVSTST